MLPLFNQVTVRKPIHYLIALYILFFTNWCWAKTIVISGEKLINQSTSYNNVTLDLTHGSFLVTNKAWLTIENSEIIGTISPDNPTLINVSSGNLILKRNIFTISAKNIQPTPLLPSLYPTLKIYDGQVRIDKNQFKVDKPFRVSLFSTNNFPTSGFSITNNTIQNFHGAFFLTDSNHAFISYNNFFNVSLSNIFTKNSSDNLYKENNILYSGNNGFDIIDSNNITLYKNYIALSNCYSILILRSQNLTLDNNYVTGGITYGIIALPSIGENNIYAKHLIPLIGPDPHPLAIYKNKNFRIVHNYLSQNRYGLSTNSMDGLVVLDNIFIQRFPDDITRKFWTNNDVLLVSTANINWKNNFYKEAYAQITPTDNDKASKFVIYPARGGVTLN